MKEESDEGGRSIEEVAIASSHLAEDARDHGRLLSGVGRFAVLEECLHDAWFVLAKEIIEEVLIELVVKTVKLLQRQEELT